MVNTELEPKGERLPRSPRKLSHFIAQELLYDYMHGYLDEDRKKALESYLREHPELQYEYRSMVEAERYAKHLAETRLSSLHIEELNQIRPATELVISKLRWKNWPDLMKWASEALVVSVVVAVTAMMVPWEKIDIKFPERSPEVTLAEIKTGPESMPQQAPVPMDMDTDEISSPLDITTAAPEKETLSTVAVAPSPASTVVPQPAVATVSETKNQNEQMDDETTAESAAAAEAKGASEKGSVQKGLLYRVMLDLDNSEEITEAVKQKILELGGKKAGQVELGWRKKNPDGSYYHFTLPETSYQQLLSTLGGYGPVRIYKSPHQRVMPEGQIRIILWMEDKPSPTQENETNQ